MTAIDAQSALEAQIKYRFRDADLLRRALSHASLDVDAGVDNERLEFLGDRVLGLLVAEALFERYPTAREGDLALRLNAVVRKESCALVARNLDLGAHLRLAKSEERTGGREKPAVLADACEALIAAIYLDGGFGAARDFVRFAFGDVIQEDHVPKRDPKTALQEWAQGQGLPLPVYAVVDRQGPDHQPNFTVSVQVDGVGRAEGQGASRRAAEQAAAQALFSAASEKRHRTGS
jgi:ribonuclease-3